MKSSLLAIIFFAFYIFFIPKTAAASTNLYLFYGEGCPHCAKEEKFLDYLEKTQSDLKIMKFEVWHNKHNQDILSLVSKKLNLKYGGVPVTIVGNEAIIGFDEAATTGVEITNLINAKAGLPDEDVVGGVLAQTTNGQSDPTRNKISGGGSKTISTFFGQVDVKKLSLPLLTIVIGLIDSLNPCAMWVLLFLLSLLLASNDRKRLWVLGGGFIFASAATYFAVLAAWLNVYQLMGLLGWLKIIIVALAAITGVVNIRSYWRNRNGGCEIQETDRKRNIINKLREYAQNHNLFLAFIGVFTLAAAVNLVELLCSAGLPAIYVPILTEANLSQFGYYSYLLLYVLFYVLIQVVIFFIAALSMRLTAVSSRITKWSNLIGGTLMILLALWLITQWF